MKDKKKKKKTTKKNVPITEEQQLKRVQSKLKRKIRNIFSGAGFEYIPTNNHNMKIGLREIEVDSLYIYENIWLICEDTVKTRDIREHIRTKNEAFNQIKNNLPQYIRELVNLFPDKEGIITKYDVEQIKVFGLYIPNDEISLSEADDDLFENLIFVQPKTLNYFQWMVQCIKLSARNEIFRFLKLTSNQIGLPKSSSEDTKIQAPIIYPKSFIGTKSKVAQSKVRVVSFMMSAEDLLNTCFVMRKDNWEESIELYQRLIEKNKIKNIRNFLENKGEAFYNNIIVALPDDVAFIDEAKKYRTIEELNELEPNCQLVLPKEINSICVIDGQHRIFAHYESGTESKQEKEISKLRKELHLLVTGLIFPANMTALERAQIQSEIFLDINSNAKPVPPNVLLHIQKIKNPLSDVSLAQFVIEKLNKQELFLNMFELSSLDNSKIKTASIVKFALRYLVTLTPAEGKESLFNYWNGNKDSLMNLEPDALDEYIKYCTDILRQFFSAIKKKFSNYWNDPNSKLLSVTSFNGFIIAFNRQLSINGVKDFSFYDDKLSNWDFDFSKENFKYTSSQYHKFSNEILKDVFDISEDIIDTL